MKKVEVADKLVKFINNVVNNFAIIILVLLMLVSVYAIIDKHQVYEDAKISDDITALKPKDNDVTFTLDELLKINTEINGWIRVNNTGIDYPVVQGRDNTRYLTSNFKGEDTGSGSIFLDYRNDVNFSDDYSIIYGHNLQSDLMFGDILNYKSKKYFKSHRKGRLYTLNAQYKLEVFSYSIIDSSVVNIYNLDKLKNGNNQYIVDIFKKYAVNYKDINIGPNDKLLALSTCDNEGTYNRSVLLARIVKDVDVKTASITTKQSKLTDEQLQEEEKAYEVPKPVKEDLRINLVPKISIYNLMLMLSIMFVLGIYAVLFKERLGARKRKLAMASAGVQQQVQAQQQVQTQVQIFEPQILQVFDVEDFFTQDEPEIYQVLEDEEDDII